jgi:hypothetical protein
MTRWLLAVIPLLAVMIISGCTAIPGGVPVSGGGVAIEAFEPDFPRLNTGETVQFRLSFRNKGSAESVVKSISISGADWLATGADMIDTCGPLANTQLLPARPDLGTQGESRNCYWEFTVTKQKVNIPEGLSITYTPIAKLSYTYRSSTIKSITIGTSQELRLLQDRGSALPAETTSKSSGPVDITIDSKGPIRVSGTEVSFPIEIKVTNTGGGIVCKTDCNNAEEWNRMAITIDTGDMDNDCQTEEISLWKGQTNTIGCKVTIRGVPEGRIQKLIQVSTGYEYLVEKTTSVTVTGAVE